MEDEIVNKTGATVVNTEVPSRVDANMIKCLFYGVINGKYQLCTSLDGHYVIIFDDGKDAMKFKLSELENKMNELDTINKVKSTMITGNNYTITNTGTIAANPNTSGHTTTTISGNGAMWTSSSDSYDWNISTSK